MGWVFGGIRDDGITIPFPRLPFPTPLSPGHRCISQVLNPVFKWWGNPDSWNYQQSRLHIHFAQFRNAPAQLHQSLHALEHAHMGEANLLDELEAGVLAEAVHGFGDAEHGADDIVAAVAERPELLQALERAFDPAFPTCFEHRLHLDRMRAVHHPEHVLAAHQPEARCGALQIVDCLSHVSLGAED